MDYKAIKQLMTRIEKLEREVFGSGSKAPNKKNIEPKYKGPTGGIQLLISKGFFNRARTAPSVKEEIAKNNYFYRIQVVQTALNRLSRRNGPLAAFKQDGKKVYVSRK